MEKKTKKILTITAQGYNENQEQNKEFEKLFANRVNNIIMDDEELSVICRHAHATYSIQEEDVNVE